MRRLVTTVHVKDDNGNYVQFVPGSEETMPDWAKRRITNPNAWYEDGDYTQKDEIPLHKPNGQADWNTLNVKQLKAELSNRGLPLDGSKADFVKRLNTHDLEIAALLEVMTEEQIAELNALSDDDKLLVVMMAEEEREKNGGTD